MTELPRDELVELSTSALVEGRSFELGRFSGLELVEADLSQRSLRTCLVERSNLTRARLRDVTLDEVVFEDCDLSSAVIGGASLTDVTFRRCKLLGIDWTATRRSLIGESPRFELCQLDFGVFQGLDLRRSTFSECSAREADFAGADLSGASFRETDLERATFGATKLVDASLVGARGYDLDPRENDVRGLRVSLPEGAALLRQFGIKLESDA